MDGVRKRGWYSSIVQCLPVASYTSKMTCLLACKLHPGIRTRRVASYFRSLVKARINSSLWGATWQENVNCKTKPWWSETGLWRSSHLQKTLLQRCHCKRLQRVDRIYCVTDCTGHDDIIDLRAFLAMNGSDICRQRRYSLQCRLDERKIRMRNRAHCPDYAHARGTPSATPRKPSYPRNETDGSISVVLRV